MQAEYNQLPTNWDEMSHQEKSIWFARHCTNYTREGEFNGIREDTPEEVVAAYHSYLDEEAQ